jgi:D-alanyl-D-alanine dipeptidase
MTFVEITAAEHGVELALAYAAQWNFTGRPIYRRGACYLHEDAARLLSRAVTLAAEMGLRLKVFDGYRPPEAQWILWNHFPDPDFLADPRKGSPHSRGVAVDLTLVDAAGHEPEMGTGFDDFTPASRHGAAGLGGEAQANRMTLLGLMTAAGWDYYRNEWWHYQLFDSRRYPLVADGALCEAMMSGGGPRGQMISRAS